MDTIDEVQVGPGRSGSLEHTFVPLAELDRFVALGELTAEEATDRRAALLSQIEGQLNLDLKGSLRYSHSLGERSSTSKLLQDLYLPAQVPGSPDHRYTLSQVGKPGEGVDQIRFANKDTGLVSARSEFVRQSGPAKGIAFPAIGIEVAPAHTFCTIEFGPAVDLWWGHRTDVPTAFGNPNSAFCRGALRLVAQKLNPSNGNWDDFRDHTVDLFRRSTVTGEGYGWITGQGHYTSKELQVFASAGERWRFWLQVVVEMSKQDNDPQASTSGEAYINSHVPFMWAVQTPV